MRAILPHRSPNVSPPPIQFDLSRRAQQIIPCIMQSVFKGPVYVVRDNIDTDQIIPAQFLNLIPTIPEEYEKLGSYALCGLPESLYPQRFVKAGQLDSEYPIVVAGRNFGCGSSREHAPIAIGSADSANGPRRKFRAHFLPQLRCHRRTLPLRMHRPPLRRARPATSSPSISTRPLSMSTPPAKSSVQTAWRCPARRRCRRPVQLRAQERDDSQSRLASPSLHLLDRVLRANC